MNVLYVSGPMSGIDHLNFPAFAFVSRRLREVGHVVINPAENWGGKKDVPRATCMRQDIQQVLLADGLAMLHGWENSAGARLERQIAAELQLDIRPWKEWL